MQQTKTCAYPKAAVKFCDHRKGHILKPFVKPGTGFREAVRHMVANVRHDDSISSLWLYNAFIMSDLCPALDDGLPGEIQC